MMRISFFTIVWSFLACTGFSQTPQEWADHVNWDGVSPYQSYYRLTAAGMGPNALPIPDRHHLFQPARSELGSDMAIILHAGEQTVCQRMYLQWQPADGVRLRTEIVAWEYFVTSREVKLERNVFWQGYDDRWAGGDFYVEAMFDLPRAWRQNWDAELRVGLKTASGTNLGSARYTDTPGYYFDLALGRKWGTAQQHQIEFSGGFYAYQTYEQASRQNDCILWGASYSWILDDWVWTMGGRGYHGYFRDGDQPVVVDLRLDRTWGGHWTSWLRVERGVIDYPFTTLRLGTSWLFTTPSIQ